MRQYSRLCPKWVSDAMREDVEIRNRWGCEIASLTIEVSRCTTMSRSEVIDLLQSLEGLCGSRRDAVQFLRTRYLRPKVGEQ